jgi:hypothetical protein
MAAFTVALATITAANLLSQYHSQRQSAKGIEKQGDYEAAMLEQNAKIAERQAQDALLRGKLEEQKIGANTRQIIGAQRSIIGAQGLDLESGSALDLQLEAASMGALDAMTIRNNARREAWGYNVEAGDARNRAVLTRYAARNAAAGQRNAATSTLLTGALQIGTMFYDSSSIPKTKTSRSTYTPKPRIPRLMER